MITDDIKSELMEIKLWTDFFFLNLFLALYIQRA